MNEEIKKALEVLISETMEEVEEMKKSRFAASEIKIEGPGEGIAGKPSDGHIEKDEDEDDEDEDDKKDMDKAEGKNKEADPGPVHHSAEEGTAKSEGKNKEADPGPVHHSAADGVAKADDEKKKKDKEEKEDPKHEDKEKKEIKKLADMHDMDKAEDKMGYMKGAIKKSQDEFSDLMKSYVDEKFAPFAEKLASIMELVNKIADQPVAPKGVTARMQPLTKSAGDESQPFSKSEIGSKLFELKKSGTQVDTMDITKAELGQDLQAIVKKYNLA